jgi:hypothetical protein
MHGGRSTGPRTAAGLASLRAARTKHGGRGREMRRLLRCAAALLQGAAALGAPEEGAACGPQKRPTTERCDLRQQSNGHEGTAPVADRQSAGRSGFPENRWSDL